MKMEMHSQFAMVKLEGLQEFHEIIALCLHKFMLNHKEQLKGLCLQ